MRAIPASNCWDWFQHRRITNKILVVFLVKSANCGSQSWDPCSQSQSQESQFWNLTFDASSYFKIKWAENILVSCHPCHRDGTGALMQKQEEIRSVHVCPREATKASGREGPDHLILQGSARQTFCGKDPCTEPSCLSSWRPHLGSFLQLGVVIGIPPKNAASMKEEKKNGPSLEWHKLRPVRVFFCYAPIASIRKTYGVCPFWPWNSYLAVLGFR